MPKIARICQNKQCNKEFCVWPSDIKRGYGKFCSIKCATTGENNPIHGRKGEKAPFYGKKHTPEEIEKIRVSHIGTKLYDVTKAKISKTRIDRHIPSPLKGKHHTPQTIKKMRIARAGKYVGKKNPNYGKHHHINVGSDNPMFGMCGKNAPNWKGGKSFEIYPPDFNGHCKERVRNAFDRKCPLCDKTTEENGRELDIHHIDYDKTNCAIDNLIPLCRRQHAKTNSDRSRWQYILEYIIQVVRT